MLQGSSPQDGSDGTEAATSVLNTRISDLNHHQVLDAGDSALPAHANAQAAVENATAQAAVEKATAQDAVHHASRPDSAVGIGPQSAELSSAGHQNLGEQDTGNRQPIEATLAVGGCSTAAAPRYLIDGKTDPDYELPHALLSEVQLKAQLEAGEYVDRHGFIRCRGEEPSCHTPTWDAMQVQL